MRICARLITLYTVHIQYNACTFVNLQKMCACGVSFIRVVVTHMIQLCYDNSI
jgi:hypothetical protein